MKERRITHLLLLLAISFSQQAQTQVVNIWPGLAPGSENVENREQWTDSKDVSNVYQPDLTVYLPEHTEGLSPAVIVLPGGGYRKLVMEKEGYKVARWLKENGMAAFVLKYRLNPEEALRDAQRAVSLLRKEADNYGIDGKKIGVIGFSAGAHLAGNLVENNQDRERYDEIDAVSSRPDFWAGVYGAYGDRSRNNRSVKAFEAHKDIPPTFLVHAGNDSRVNVMGSVELYSALIEKGVPVELHVYEQGEHGFALEKDRGAAVTSTVTDWSKRFLAWLQVRGIL
jgi:acetyl esterase/lipase